MMPMAKLSAAENDRTKNKFHTEFVYPNKLDLLNAAAKMFTVLNLGRQWNQGKGWSELMSDCGDSEWELITDELGSWKGEFATTFRDTVFEPMTLQEVHDVWDDHRGCPRHKVI